VGRIAAQTDDLLRNLRRVPVRLDRKKRLAVKRLVLD
jgi:hypothetical protein